MTDNPGRDLLAWLERRYPPRFESSTIAALDRDFGFDERLEALAYWSHIYATARRLVRGSVHAARVTPGADVDTSALRNAVRQFVARTTYLGKGDQAELIALLLRCVDAYDDDISGPRRRELIAECQRLGGSCAYCGQTLRFDVDNLNESATLDHIFPRSLGGCSEKTNLVVVCRHCNSDLKKDVVDHSDSHYEHFSLICEDLDRYLRSRPSSYDHAIRASNNFRCHTCNQPARKVGELLVARLDVREAFTFSNLAPFCTACVPEVRNGVA